MALQFLYGQIFETPTLPTTDLSNRTIIVTGANSGLGLDAAKHLYRLKCSHIILACRDLTKGEKAKHEVLQSKLNHKPTEKTTTPKQETEISVWQIDMSSYASVASFVSRAATLPQLHGAILNAGVSLTEFTLAESLESTLTVNVTSTFLLAILLVPVLRHTAQRDTGTTPHLSIVGSAVHHFAKHEQLTGAAKLAASNPQTDIFKTLSDPTTAKMADRYFLSKLLVMLLTVHLADLLSKSPASSSAPIILNCVAPGYCRTSLFRHEETAVSRLALRLIGRSSEKGSRPLVHGAVEAGEESHGAYLSECRIKKTSRFVRSDEGMKMGALLWDEVAEIAERVVPGCTGNF